VRPAARSTASTAHKIRTCANVKFYLGRYITINSPGMTKLSNGASSGITALGKTNAPVDISGISGVVGEEGLDTSTTLAKCVGTATLGGEPITSCVYRELRSVNAKDGVIRLD
jgi:hypothetical protein